MLTITTIFGTHFKLHTSVRSIEFSHKVKEFGTRQPKRTLFGDVSVIQCTAMFTGVYFPSA